MKKNNKNEVSMKKILSLMVILLSIYSIFANEITTRKLSNGMQIAVKRKTTSNSVGLFCFVKTGSIHEEEFLGKGISHYLEHIVSGGTTSKRTEAEYNEIEKSIGAVTNAFTTYDLTAYHSLVDAEYVDIALEMLSEQVMYCSFDEKEVNREMQVILKEIIMRSTPPFSKMYQRANEVFYPNTYYKHPIIGFVEHFETLTRDDLIKYYNDRYTPDNMVFVAVGNFETEEMLDKIENAFSGFSKSPAKAVFIPQQPVALTTYREIDEFDLEQSYVLINRQLPVDKPQDYYALLMATDILFGKRNSPLTYYFEEETQLVNFIYSSVDFSPVSAKASLTTMFETSNTENIDRIISLLNDKLKEFTKPKKIRQNMLDSFIKRLEAERFLGSKSIEDEAIEIGFSLINFNIPNELDYTISELRKVTIADVQRVINEYYLNNQVIFLALPKGQKVHFLNNEEKNITKTELNKISVSKRLTLLHKQNDEKPVVRGLLFIPSGTDYETETDAGTLNFMTNLLFSGSKKYSSLVLSDWLEERSISLNANANRLGIFINFSCLTDDLDELANRLIDSLTNPLFDESDIALAKNRLYANFMRMLSSPNSIHADFRSQHIYDSERERLTAEQNFLIVSSLTREDILRAYNKYVTADKLTFSLIGDIDENKAQRFANLISSKIPNRQVSDTTKTLELKISDSTFVQVYPFEQVNLDLNLYAPPINDRKEFITMEVISSILNGSRGRIHNSVRGDNDLAYFAYASYMYGDNYGMLRLTSQTSPDKKDELISVLKNEIEKLKNELVSEKEIQEAITDNYKTMKNYLEDELLVYFALHNEVLGLGYDYFENSINEMKKVTPEDIKNLANKYFKDITVIVSQPE